MNLSSFTLSRGLRLALLLFLLASQGIANAHALGVGHSLDTDTCSTCVIGHGLGVAIGISHEAPHVRLGIAPLPTFSITDTRVSFTHSHLARAPPGALWNIQNPN